MAILRLEANTIGRLLFVSALLTATAASAATPNGLGAPTPNLLFQLERQNRNHPWLRVTTDSSQLTLRARGIDELGMRGLRSRQYDPPPPDPIAWNAIARIDEVTTKAHQGRVTGFLVVGLAGAILGNMIGAAHGEGKSDALLGLAGFGSLGAWQGGRFGERFVRDRSWYVAAPAATPLAASTPAAGDAPPETTLATITPPGDQASPPPTRSSGLAASRGILRAVGRIGSKRLIRMRGEFGRFEGLAGVVGPEGLEGLRLNRRRQGMRSAPVGLVPWDRIQLVEVRGKSVGRGAIVGAIGVGLFTGLVAAAAVAVADGTETSTTAFFEGTVVGGGVGAALGGLVGAAFPAWHVVYRRPTLRR